MNRRVESLQLVITLLVALACGGPQTYGSARDSIEDMDVRTRTPCPPGYHWQEFARYDPLTERREVFHAECMKDRDADDQPAVNPGVTPDSHPPVPRQNPGACAAPRATHSDDQDCAHIGSGGVSGFPNKFVTCTYNCAGIEHLIVLPSGMVRCPGADSKSVKWKNIKGFRRRY